MSITLSSMRIAVFTVRFNCSASRPSAFVCWWRFTEPRLHTAISPALVFSVISVHRFELCTTPMCPCGERRLHTSLNVIHGCPVSNSIVSIFRHSSTAFSVRAIFISPAAARRSYASYFSRNAFPYRSCSSGVSSGENSVHGPSASTRSINRSGTQFAVFMSCVLRRSSPVFLRISRNSSMSMCHVSRYAHTAPLRLPPWFTAMAVSLATFKNGTTPWLCPLVPLMCDPSPRTGVQSLPRPPAYLLSSALSLIALKIPSRSSPIVVRKHELSCGRCVPALNSVGVEHMKSKLESRS